MVPPTHPDYSVKEYEEGLEEGIVELLNLGFNGWPHIDISCDPVDYWRWKYLSNPTRITSLHTIIDEDKIISCYHAQPLYIKIWNKTRLCSSRGDLTVHPDYRGKGVWSFSNKYTFYTEPRDGLEMVYYLTGNETIIKRMSKMRPQFPHRLVNFTRIKNIELHLEHMSMEREWIVKTGFKALKTINRLVYEDRGETQTEINIEQVEGFDVAFDRFWNKVSPGYEFIVERSQGYLNWKYADPRTGTHIIYTANRGGAIVAYIILRVNRYIEGYPVGYIVDILALPNETAAIRRLVSKAVDYFEKQDINIVNCLLVKGSVFEPALREQGFLDSRIKIHIFYQPYDIEEEMNKLSKVPKQRLHFTWGDHDSLPLSVSKT